MDFSKTSTESQKLIRCIVQSKNRPESLRYVELEHYKLWSYMMFHKHGLKIRDASLWFWVWQKEIEEKKEHYAHFPVMEKVNKIVMFIFDEVYGFTHTMHRFAPEKETSLLETALLSHISPEIIKSGNFDMQRYPGYCFQCGKNLKNMILGLSGADDRIWYRAK